MESGRHTGLRSPCRLRRGGSTPPLVTVEMGVSSNGKTVGLHPADEGSTPSTVHCSRLARWWNGRHAVLRRPCPSRGVRVQVPPWSLLFVHAWFCFTLSCGFKRWPSEGRLAGSTPAWGTAWVVSRLRALGLRNPVGRFDSCTTYFWPGPRKGIGALNLDRVGSTPALAAKKSRRCSTGRAPSS